jgi:streptogramin lyase
MLKHGTYRLVTFALLFAAILTANPKVFSRSVAGKGVLAGTVKSVEGKPLAGVGVSARCDAQTFTTTVYTDQNGNYSFPQLEPGDYRIWAQAVGFDSTVKDAVLATGHSNRVELTVSPLKDFSKQLSGAEWVESLPEQPGDRRMKVLFTSNCIGCHTASFPLQNRFDASGWHAIFNIMSKIKSLGYIADDAETDEPITAYADELATYLARVRGPSDTPLDVKVLPRPSGDAARIVVTEFDISRPDIPGWLMKHNGTDWSEGTPSRWNGRAVHDVALDKNGFVWFADDATPERTVAKLDPRTGKVTDYKLPNSSNQAEDSHALVFDKTGLLWLASGTLGNPVQFDPKTETFRKFPRPAGLEASGDFISVDGNNDPWSPTTVGAYKLDPQTGKYTNYTSGHPPKNHYDMAVDRENNAWVALIGDNRLLKVDAETGKVDELELGYRTDSEANDRDREINSTRRLTANTSTPLQKGPRRMAADRNGDFVWFTEFFADRIAKVDIHTRKVTEYPVPHMYTQPYAITVDDKHMVWFTMLSADRIAKFNPFTEKFTEYALPTLGTEIRHIQIDNTTNPPTVWLPYDRTNKIARIQFR